MSSRECGAPRTDLLGRLAGRVQARIHDERELRAFIARTAAICVAVALSVDIANQLIFFQDWQAAIRSWTVTVVVAAAIALPVLFIVGRAYLELYRAKAAVDELSRTDPLTGLLNRRALFDGTSPPCAMALVIIDIDRFKRVNDRHGHLVGDEVIRSIANILRQALSDVGQIGRLGGEEFAVLSSERDQAWLGQRVERFRDQVAATPIICGRESVHVTVSAGLAAREPDQSFDELYAAADRALYFAKAAGRNRVVLASEVPEPGPPSPSRPSDRGEQPARISAQR